ncbi:hypothetical protein GCM10023156_31740 [Novipirellula rosea]|uniref:Uncharacterized protein n=1 Tax=Novipirellula rosea TaxID=1031540 RepID=A0ABP8MUP8_9BACT
MDILDTSKVWSWLSSQTSCSGTESLYRTGSANPQIANVESMLGKAKTQYFLGLKTFQDFTSVEKGSSLT